VQSGEEDSCIQPRALEVVFDEEKGAGASPASVEVQAVPATLPEAVPRQEEGTMAAGAGGVSADGGGELVLEGPVAEDAGAGAVRAAGICVELSILDDCVVLSLAV